MARSNNYIIIWMYCIDFPRRDIPVVYLSNGKPSYLLNQYIYGLLEDEITPSSLEKKIMGPCFLYDLHMSAHLVRPAQGIIQDFIDAKKYGTDEHCLVDGSKYDWLHQLGLNWQPVSRFSKTIDDYIIAINNYDNWQAIHHNVARINPVEERYKSNFEIYSDFKKRTDYDPLIHLHASRNHTTKQHKTYAKGRFFHKRHKTARNHKKTPKYFPINKFFDLVVKSKNPRDQMLFQLKGTGSLRGSDALHLFQSDIEFNPKKGIAQVLLADPEFGHTTWTDAAGKVVHDNRQNYFEREYQNLDFTPDHPLYKLQPRTLYGKRNSRLHVGFKGMTFGDSDNTQKLSPNYFKTPDKHYIWFLSDDFAKAFWIMYQKYQRNYLWRNNSTGEPTPQNWPWHPWLFISTYKQNYGMPLTVSALKKAWKRALTRIGMENSGYGLHSLRHMYGYICANSGIPIETTQILMHHASIKSTEIYYQLADSTIRQMIEEAAISQNLFKNWRSNLDELPF
ncbi:MAG: hypothetical protein ACI8ZB_003804 [Desulforhopalus sp.]|jgi:hypothetical protein